MKKVIEFDQKCASCSGTGLYVGMGECDGAAVVCRSCGGEGKSHFRHEYEDFEGREHRDGVLRVFEVNPGLCVGRNRERGLFLEDFGGMSPERWEQGASFELGMENRKFTCPAWWYQAADYGKKPAWDECCGCGSFADCKQFERKSVCWERFDSEQEARP